VVQISPYQNRITAEPGTPLHRLLTGYLDQLDASPLRHIGALPYSFASYHDGAPILPAQQRAFRRLSRQNRAQIENPFAARQFMEELVARSPPDALPYHAALARVVELEREVARLQPGLKGTVGRAMDRVVPGSRDRVYHTMRDAAHSRNRMLRGSMSWVMRRLGMKL
jgi:hypothetical protein